MLDGQAAALNNNTTTLTRRPQTVRGAGRSQHPDQWQNFTEVNIAKAEKERENSKNLRSVTDGVLRQTTGEIRLFHKHGIILRKVSRDAAITTHLEPS